MHVEGGRIPRWRPSLAPELLLLLSQLWTFGAAIAAPTSEDESVCLSTDPDCGDAGSKKAGTGVVRPLPELELKAKDSDFPRYYATDPDSPRVWTVEELALHNGTNKSRPLLLCVLGEVFDVGTGSKFYATEKGYSIFAGHDNSRAFADTNLKLDADSMTRVEDLEKDDFSSVLGWRDFYRKHKTYRFVGVLQGRYFDALGGTTEEARRVEDRHDIYAAEELFKKELKQRWKTCNNRFQNGQPNVVLWCDDNHHTKGSVPVYIYAGEVNSKGKQEGWCACVPPAERAAAEKETLQANEKFRIVDYPECRQRGNKLEQRCERPRSAPPP